jgi:Flp pilus assembly protein TadG
MFTRLAASVWRDDEGSVLIEATILMPFLVTLMFGVFEFSWYFHKQQLVESGVRDAARYLARVQDVAEGSNPCSSGTDVTNAQNIAVYGTTTGGTARVPGWTTGSVNISCTTFNNSGATYDGGSTIYLINATTNFADPALGYFGMLGLTLPNLSASHSERSIGPG